MGTSDAVLDRLAQALDAKDDSALARALAKSRTTVSSWRSRGKVPYEACVAVAERQGVSLNWLLLGVGPEQMAAEDQVAAAPRKPEDEFRDNRIRYLRAERMMAEAGQSTGIELPRDLAERVLELVYLYDLDKKGAVLALDLARVALGQSAPH